MQNKKINKNGQISIDLIFSLIIVLIFITTLTFFINDFKETREDINLENNLKKQSINLASFITSASIMADTNFTSKILIERINYKSELIIPNIYLDQNSITIEYNNKKAKTYFANNNLTKKIENNYLVIASE